MLQILRRIQEESRNMSDEFLSKLSSSYLRRTPYVRGSEFGADTRAIRVGGTFPGSDRETIFGIVRGMR